MRAESVVISIANGSLLPEPVIELSPGSALGGCQVAAKTTGRVCFLSPSLGGLTEAALFCYSCHLLRELNW